MLEASVSVAFVTHLYVYPASPPRRLRTVRQPSTATNWITAWRPALDGCFIAPNLLSTLSNTNHTYEDTELFLSCRPKTRLSQYRQCCQALRVLVYLKRKETVALYLALRILYCRKTMVSKGQKLAFCNYT